MAAGLVCSAERWPWSSAGWQANRLPHLAADRNYGPAKTRR